MLTAKLDLLTAHVGVFSGDVKLRDYSLREVCLTKGRELEDDYAALELAALDMYNEEIENDPNKG